jgi:hypothetical protein
MAKRRNVYRKPPFYKRGGFYLFILILVPFLGGSLAILRLYIGLLEYLFGVDLFWGAVGGMGIGLGVGIPLHLLKERYQE